MSTTTTEYLETYLQDHRAGAAGGAGLARRLAEENAGTPYEDFLLRLAQEIEQDVATLEEIMDGFGVDKPTLKIAGAKFGEKLARLKPNEHLASYSPLSRVLELEGLRGGVQAKLALWESLREIAAADGRLDRDEMQALVERAEGQLDGLREHHNRAAREAFADA